MVGHWLTTAWRSLVANPLFSLITLASLSVGCCGALLTGANIKQHLSFDRWIPNNESIALMFSSFESLGIEGLSKQPSAVPGIGDLAKGKIPDLIAATSVLDGPPIEGRWSPGDEPPILRTGFVDGYFFDVFALPFAEGNPKTALTQPEMIIVTETVAKKLFGDAPALGKAVELGKPVKRMWRIGGVLKDLPAATHLQYNSLASAEAIDMLEADHSAGKPSSNDPMDVGYSRYGGTSYLRFAPYVDVEVAAKTATPLIEAMIRAETLAKVRQNAGGRAMPAELMGAMFSPEKRSLVPLRDVHFGGEEKVGYLAMVSGGDLSLLAALGAASAALLVVSAFNYVTLSLARNMRRQREVAMRKVLGAGHGAIMRHYLAESAVMTAISLAAGFALAELIQPWFARLLQQKQALFDLHDPLFLAAALAVFVVLALAVGAYPAVYLANVRPRNGLEDSISPGQGIVARVATGGMLGFQIAAASVLLTVALTMGLQARYVSERPLGFSLKDVHRIYYNCPEVRSIGGGARCEQDVIEVLKASPEVRAIAVGTIPSPGGGFIQSENFARASNSASLGKAAVFSVDTELLQMVKANLLAGRYFDRNSAFDRQLLDPSVSNETPERVPIIVSRAMLKLLGVSDPQEAIGQRLVRKGRMMEGASMAMPPEIVAGFAGIMSSMSGPGARPRETSYEIVGVVEDWHRRSLRFAVDPIVFMPGGGSMEVVAEIDSEDRRAVAERLRRELSRWIIDGRYAPFFEVAPAALEFEMAYRQDKLLMWTVAGFAGVSILVACLGVYALSAFEMRRRVREIGIRKALGAAPMSVAGMVMGRNIRSAGIAAVLSWPVGWWMASLWLNGFVYRTSLGLAILPAAAALVIVFVALAVGFNALRAAAVRPNVALRTTG